MIEQKLLTIAIPTYNRSAYLNKCINSFVSQIDSRFEDVIELIISDNASTDNTQDIISKYKKYAFVRSILNEQNIGPDRNFNSCYEKATGKYLWLVGDDDFMLPGYFEDIITLLQNNELGVIHISHQSFTNDNEVIPEVGEFEVTNHLTGVDFVKRLHYHITFVSSHIFNKNIVKFVLTTPPQYNTNLIQIEWYITAIMESNDNAIIENKILASKSDNTGGYKLVTTFAKNYNKILKGLVESKKYDKKIIYFTNKNLLQNFFPFFLNRRLVASDTFIGEREVAIMFNIFWKYKLFWKNIAPIYLRLFLKKIRS